MSLDVNHRAALWTADEAGPVLAELAARADVLFAGEDEAGLLGAAGDPEAVVRALAELGPPVAVLKRGARGALAVVDGALVHVPAHPVVAVDPVGAGDAFVGGYLAELLLGADAEARLADRGGLRRLRRDRSRRLGGTADPARPATAQHSRGDRGPLTRSTPGGRPTWPASPTRRSEELTCPFPRTP